MHITCLRYVHLGEVDVYWSYRVTILAIQLSIAFSTASDRKLGGAWERGYHQLWVLGYY